MTGIKSRLFPGKSAKPDSSNINPSSSNNAAPSSSDEISEVRSSLIPDSPSLAHAGRDKVAETGSPLIPSAPNPEKLRDHAERTMEAAEQHIKLFSEANEGSGVADLDVFFGHISQLSDFIKVYPYLHS